MATPLEPLTDPDDFEEEGRGLRLTALIFLDAEARPGEVETETECEAESVGGEVATVTGEEWRTGEGERDIEWALRFLVEDKVEEEA